ncbi:hypothetical protein HDU78_009152 [Chytriomyces hyalinus]|nr:hypothetical protein HDU78_009152 [Chytriomyces hyalinus]
MTTFVPANHLQVRAGGTCMSYSGGGYCSSYVTYPLYLPPGATVSKNEGLLKAGGIDLLLSLNASTPSYRPCVSAFLEWTCYSVYPSCKQDDLDQVACKSVCDDAVTKCAAMFALFGKSSALPDCSKPIQNLNVAYSSEKTCLGYKSALPKVEVESPPPPPVKCPSFLIKNPAYNDSDPGKVLPSVLGQTCTGPCCVPCPLIHQFYEEEANDAVSTIILIISIISFVLASFILLSFIVFPAKRAFPHSLIVVFTLSAFGLHATQLASLVDPTRVTCIDRITEASQKNSSACAVEGFLLIFFAISLTTWISVFMLNLHMALVWKSDLIQRHIYAISAVAVLVCLVPPVALSAANAIASIGITCMFDADHAVTHYFIPVGLVGIPGSLLTFYTVAHLIRQLKSTPDARRVKKLEPSQSNPAKSSPTKSNPTKSNPTKSNPVKSNPARGNSAILLASAGHAPEEPGPTTDAQGKKPEQNVDASLIAGATAFRKSKLALNATTTTRETEKMQHLMKEHREKMWSLFEKSWRSIAICACFIVIFFTFWGFYLRFAILMAGVNTSTEWVQVWYGCVMQGKSRNECAAVARPFVPSLVGTAAAQYLISSIGIWIFLVFGGSMVEEWRNLVKGKGPK